MRAAALRSECPALGMAKKTRVIALYNCIIHSTQLAIMCLTTSNSLQFRTKFAIISSNSELYEICEQDENDRFEKLIHSQLRLH